ncbi:MAG TPA: hypothetical protein VMT19_07975 [Thermoanaerobaculaceae bacterium]|nr:hypothetical protein [Thermoanaerobaculaceae bacterium]
MSTDTATGADGRARTVLSGAVVPTLVLAPLLAGVAVLLVHALHLEIRMPLQLNYVEGFNADDAARLARGAPLYGDPSRAPFVVTVYTPVYLAAAAALIRLGLPALASARLLAFLGAALSAAVIGWAGWRRTGWIAIAAAGLFFVDPLVPFWQVAARPDSAALVLAILGIVILDRGGGGRADVVAALLFAGSLLAKQSSVAAPVAVLAYLLGADRARARRFALVLVAAVAVPVLTLEAASHGRFLWHVVAGNLDPFSWRRAAALGGSFWAHHPLHLALLLALFLAGWRARRRSPVALWAVLASLVGTTALGKGGSDQNYLLEALAAIALLAARELPVGWLRRRALVPAACAVVLAASAVIVAATSAVEAVSVHRPVAAAQRPYRELMAWVARAPGIVVSDDACLLLANRQPVHIQPFVMTQLARAGRWDQTPFLRELESGKVRLIVAQLDPPSTFASRYTPEMRKVIAGRYAVAARYDLAGRYTVLVPLDPR